MTIFTNGIDPNLEEDVQWVFIKALSIQDGRLMVTSESGKTYQVDVNTKAITQSDSRIVPIARSDSRRTRRSQKSPNERVDPEKSMTSPFASTRPIWKEILMATARWT